MWQVLIRELPFADDEALTAYSQEGLQRLIKCFARACKKFGLSTSLTKTNILGTRCQQHPKHLIGDFTLEVVKDFIYFGSTISSNLYLDAELNKQIGKAATAMARLAKRVWDNSMPTINTKMQVYRAVWQRSMYPLLPPRA